MMFFSTDKFYRCTSNCPFSLAFLFIMFCGYLQATEKSEKEQIDSILEFNNSLDSDSLLVDNFNELAYLYGGISLDSSLQYLAFAKEKALKANYTKGLAVNYSYYARVYMQKGALDIAIQKFDSALILFSAINDTAYIIDCYKGLSYIYSYSASQLNCLECNMKALPLAQALADTVSLAVIYNNIGTFYYKLNDYSSSYEYFTKSIALDESVSGNGNIALCYFNLGMLTINHQKSDDAKTVFQKIITLLPDINDGYEKLHLELALAAYYNSVGELDSALIYIDKAYALAIEHDFDQVLVQVYQRYGEWYFLSGKYKKSVSYYTTCLALSQKLGISKNLPEIYAKRAESYFALANYKEAFESMKLSRSAVDSLENKKLSLFIGEYEEQKQKQQIEQTRLISALKVQQSENEAITIKNRFIVLLFITLLMLITIAFVVFVFVRTKRKNQLLKTQNYIIEKQKIQLEQSVSDLQKRTAELDHANATKDKFLSIIAHDLKSPFSSLIGFSDLIIDKLEKNETDKVLAYSKLINQVSKQSFALLNNLLEWALDKVGKMSFSPQSTNINSFLNDVMTYFSQLAPERNIKLKTTLSDDFDMELDHKMMQSIMRNLISNALKYTNNDGLITVGVTPSEGAVEFSIADDGIGMDERMLNKLFKIEEAESMRGLRNEKGTGLGLLLCKDFVEKHKGAIWVESKLGKGSVFKFTIPF